MTTAICVFQFAHGVDEVLHVALRPGECAGRFASDDETGVDHGLAHVGDGALAHGGIADHAAPATRRFFAGFELRFDQGNQRTSGA